MVLGVGDVAWERGAADDCGWEREIGGCSGDRGWDSVGKSRIHNSGSGACFHLWRVRNRDRLWNEGLGCARRQMVL